MNIDLSNKKVLSLIIICIVIAILAFSYYKIICLYRINHLFAVDASKYAEEIEKPVFKLEKILTYSDANVEDLSEDKNLSNINISQYTDFAIYINNKKRTQSLTEENTINKIYIDNISITPTEFGKQKVSYKDIQNLCKYEKINQGVNKIDYKVIHRNSEKSKEKSKNIFYTDCSEPLVVSYVNENIVKNMNISNSQERLSLDGSILKYLGVDLEKLKYKFSFTINIENNLGEKFACDCSLNINLNSSDGGIYTGYIMELHDMTDNNYIFRKVD